MTVDDRAKRDTDLVWVVQNLQKTDLWESHVNGGLLEQRERTRNVFDVEHALPHEPGLELQPPFKATIRQRGPSCLRSSGNWLGCALVINHRSFMRTTRKGIYKYTAAEALLNISFLFDNHSFEFRRSSRNAAIAETKPEPPNPLR